MSWSATELVHLLRLQPHPEGGHFRETYRAEMQVPTPRGPRAASTAILYLVSAGERSRWHRIAADEAWHHHGGGGLVIHELTPAGRCLSTTLGLDLAAGQVPQHVVAAGHWFAAEPIDDNPWSLVSCTVAPGFDFADFELAQAHDLAPHASSLALGCRHWQRFLEAL